MQGCEFLNLGTNKAFCQSCSNSCSYQIVWFPVGSDQSCLGEDVTALASVVHVILEISFDWFKCHCFQQFELCVVLLLPDNCYKLTIWCKMERMEKIIIIFLNSCLEVSSILNSFLNLIEKILISVVVVYLRMLL